MSEKIVCIRKEPWQYVDGRGLAPGPAFMEECTVTRSVATETGDPFVKKLWFYLEGYSGRYSARNFRPLEDIT